MVAFLSVKYFGAAKSPMYDGRLTALDLKWPSFQGSWLFLEPGTSGFDVVLRPLLDPRAGFRPVP